MDGFDEDLLDDVIAQVEAKEAEEELEFRDRAKQALASAAVECSTFMSEADVMRLVLDTLEDALY